MTLNAYVPFIYKMNTRDIDSLYNATLLYNVLMASYYLLPLNALSFCFHPINIFMLHQLAHNRLYKEVIS